MLTTKKLILKKYFFELLKDMEVNNTITVYSKNKEIKFTKLNKTTFLINGEIKFRYNGLDIQPEEIDFMENNEIKLKDLRKNMNWQLKYFIDEEVNFDNKNISISKKSLENKEKTEKLFNLQKNFSSTYLEIKKENDNEDIDEKETLRISPYTIERLNEVKLKNDMDHFNTIKSLLFYSFKSPNFYKNLKLTFDKLGYESKLLNPYCIELNNSHQS